MICYFLNIKRIVSKKDKVFFIMQVADLSGTVSELFVSEDIFKIASSFLPFDRIVLNISLSSGRVNVESIEKN